MTFSWQLAGAFAFGLMLGWNVYFVNRYRKGDVSFGDIATLVGVIGGAAVLALFPANTDLFGAYGLGLAVGFFSYFLSLLAMVKVSPNFDSDWFLDGRRKDPPAGYGYGSEIRQTLAPMAFDPAPTAALPNVTVAFHGANPGEAAAISYGAMPNTPLSMLSAPNPDATTIVQHCKDVWSQSGEQGPFKNACNFYVIEVGHRVGITLSGTADQIINMITNDSAWTKLSDGLAARDAATQGKLVVAGVESTAYMPHRNEGHVVVVTPGAMNGAGWAPAGYWGSTDLAIRALGGDGSPISRCFIAAVKDKIVYRCREI